MQQLGSNYRGDSSDTLGNIMQGQYAPLAMLNQFTSGITQTAMNNDAANRRTDAQISSSNFQSKMQRDMMNKQFSLTHALNLGNQDLAAQAQQFGQQRDIANFGQTGARDAASAKYQESMAGAAGVTAGAAWNNSNTSAYATMVAPGVAKQEKIDDENLSAEARWDMYMQELTGIRGTLDQKKDSGRISGIDNWLTKLGEWKTHANSRHYLNAYKESRLSDPVIGIGMNNQTKQRRGWTGR